MEKRGGVFSGALLVAGTSIGGGMLALPVLTSLGGFVPSLFIYLVCWLFMATTGLLLLELSLAYGEGANLITMAQRTLGPFGKLAAWLLYLFLFYCLTIAYMVGCGNILSEYLPRSLSEAWGPLIFTLVFSPFIWAGTRFTTPINMAMMFLLGALYLVFIALGYSHVKSELLARKDWPSSLIALPIAFTSFAYQGIIPTLTSYMAFKASEIRRAILIGSFIPLITYAVWQWLILGIIPVEGTHGLRETLELGQNAVWPLRYFIGSPGIWLIGQYFAFFALLTSFFGVTLGLMDFLADGLRVEKTPQGRLWLAFLIFIPPLLVAVSHPHIFLIALDWAGGYGCALLLGLMPILMVGVKRYWQQDLTHVQVQGGRPLLVILSLFVLFELLIETLTF